MAFILIYIIHFNLFYFVVCGFSIGVGDFILIRSMTKDIKNVLTAFDDCVKLESNPNLLFKQLFDFIHFHSIVKRYAIFSTEAGQQLDSYIHIYIH